MLSRKRSRSEIEDENIQDPGVSAFVAGLVDPKLYQGGIPYAGGYALARKVCKGSCEVIVDATTTEGYVLWFPKLGYDSVMAFTPCQGDVTVTSIGAGGLQYTYLDGSPIYDDRFDLKIRPDISETFAVSRVASGFLRAKSSTVSGGNFALGGTFTLGSVNDLRDMPMLFSTSDLNAACVTEKDYITDIPAAVGGYCVVGPDVPTALRPSEGFGLDTADNTYSSRVSYAWKNTDTVSIFTAANDEGCVRVVVPPGLNATVYETDIKYWWLSRRVTVRKTDNSAQNIRITAWWVTRVGGMTYYLETHGDHSLNNVNTYFQFVANCPAWGCKLVAIEVATSAPFEGFVGIEIMDLYSEHTLGGVKAIMWKGMTTGQTININAEIAIEGIATGAIAPYVKASATPYYHDETTNWTFVRNLFNDPGNGDVRRVYAGPPDGYVTHLAVTSAYGKAAGMLGKASGLFSSLGSALGSIFGGTGSKIGGLLGAAGDEALGF